MKATLERKLALLLLVTAGVAAALDDWASRWLHSSLLGWLLVLGVAIVPALRLASGAVRPIRRLLRGLSSTAARYREGDFSSSIVVDRNDELGELAATHNDLATTLRQQRAHLIQRQLLLETVMQNSPESLLLVDAFERVAYANSAARHLFDNGRTLNGLLFADVLARSPESLRVAAQGHGDSLFVTQLDGGEETFHLSQRPFVLQGQHFRLYLVKRLTREVSRQEVATWKKLIRVLSHELNNSLGPIGSLAHSGLEIARRQDYASLPAVFSAIADRAEHLNRFLSGYATFAKLPMPQPERVEWQPFLADLEKQVTFKTLGSLPDQPGWFDRAQIGQALVNLLKNAHEAGGPADAVEIAITCTASQQHIAVHDRGSGMSQSVLSQALLPFYSTKRSGTGLGLALTREIVEAHGGRIRLVNREGGGLSVTLELPYSIAS